MRMIEIDVDTLNGVGSQRVNIAEDATIDELAKQARAAGVAIGELEDEVILLVENEEKIATHRHKISDCGVKHGHHVHFKKHKSELTVQVFAPRAPEPKKFTWPKGKLVGAAADEAAKAFGYEGGKPGLMKDKVVLDDSKTLAAAGVHDHDCLELTDKGGGV